MLALPVAAAPPRDHDEFDAWLSTPFRAEGARRVMLAFTHPGMPQGMADWQLALLASDGTTVRRWSGRARLARGAAPHVLTWRPGPRMAAGVYVLRLTARAPRDGPPVVQERRIAIGTPAVPVLARPGLAAAPPEWEVYRGNLHSQTSHSDGGGPVADCHGAQHPQSAAAGPAEAYAYARQHGLDFLMASEHNHMYDGSEGTDPSADPAQARALYRSGLEQAAAFNAAHPGFAALYGLEWGVITNGGHLNVLNAPELLGWERSASGEPFADTVTPKGDYAALYTLMRQRGWIGQFNHPGERQFVVGGEGLGYTADGDAAMALCEVANSAAFSAREDESEQRISNYERQCVRALEAGYHVAFTSDQDNHCANWGASAPNRTGVLLPLGTPLTPDTLLEAIRARRVFATLDKAATLVLRANGHVMGERFANTGTLTLAIEYTGAPGRGAAEVVIVAGVPGRHGTPDTTALTGGEVTLAPEPGEHYYYARLTQDDGAVLWSAPVWVTQR